MISFRRDWPGEYRLMLFGHATNLCVMNPRQWPPFNLRISQVSKNERHYCIRLFWVDLSWSRFKKEVQP